MRIKHFFKNFALSALAIVALSITSPLFAKAAYLIYQGGTGTSTSVTNGITYSNGTILTEDPKFTWNGSKLGVGTSSPTSLLNISGSDAGTTITAASNAMLDITNSNTTNNNFGDLSFSTADLTGNTVTISKIVGVNTVHTGSATSGDLAFLTRNAGTLSEKMRILASGNVGIGTSTPLSTLSVVGSGTTNPFIISSSTGTAMLTLANNGVLTNAGTYNGAGVRSTAAVSSGTNAAAYIASPAAANDLFLGAPAVNATGRNLVFVTSGSLIQAVASAQTGNWGIGSTTTSAVFHIQAPPTSANVSGFGSLADLFDVSTTTSAAYATSSLFIVKASGNLGISTSTPLAKLDIYGTAGTSDIFAISSSSNARLFTFTSSGRLGIGTSSPNDALDVRGDGIIRVGSGSGTGQILGESGGSAYRNMININSSNVTTVGVNTGQINLGSATMLTVLGTTGTPVGIGTSTPIAKLDIYGVGGASPFRISSSTNAAMFEINQAGATLFNNQAGTSGFVLQSFGASAPPQWVSTTTLGFSGGGGSGSISTSTALVSGNVDFSTGASTIGNDSNFFWDATNHRLGLASSTPGYLLSIKGANTASTTTSVQFTDSANTSIFSIGNGGKIGIDNTPSSGITTSALEIGDANWQSGPINTEVTIGSRSASRVPLLIKAASGQTAPLFEITDTFGNPSFTFPASGIPSFGLGFNTGSAGMQIQGGNFYSVKATGNDLEIINNSNGTLPFYATSLGMVGIGSSTPLSTLSVTGSGTTNPFTVASSSGNSMFSVNTSGTTTINNLAGTGGAFVAVNNAGQLITTTTPSGGGSGTVTSVALTTPTGLSISGSPITTSGTLALSLTAGYVIPLTASTTDWQTAFSNRITSLTNTGTGVATLSANVLNIPLYAGTTTSNTWAGTQTFTNAPILTGLSGLLQGNGSSAITAVTGTAGQFPYYNGTNTLMATSSIFLATSGNVGIGSTSPNAKLSIDAPSGTADYFHIGSSTGDVMGIAPATSPGFQIGTTTHPWTMTIVGTMGVTGLPAASAGNVVLCITSAFQFILGNSATGCSPSTEKDKFDIATSTTGLAEIMRLHPVSFYYNKDINGGDDRQFLGFLAEELAKVIPQAVQYDKDGNIVGIRWDNMLNPVIKSIQELGAIVQTHQQELDTHDAEIETLKAQTTVMQLEIDQLKNGSSRGPVMACTL